MTTAVRGPLLDRLYRRSGGARWQVGPERLRQALEESTGRALGERAADRASVERYLETLHVDDLALACACADGHDPAWDHVVRELRPVLYRAADALDPGGGARDLADSLYADLYGLDERGGVRRSLFRYYHGRSSLATWLRAVLAQRHVDRIRAGRRVESLPDAEPPAPVVAPPDPDRARWLGLVDGAMTRAIRALEPRDRLRLASYYADGMTLAAIGRITGEHEATVSRHLARLRRTLRADVERELEAAGLARDAVAQCLASVAADPGTIDLGRALAQEHRGPLVQGGGE